MCASVYLRFLFLLIHVFSNRKKERNKERESERERERERERGVREKNKEIKLNEYSHSAASSNNKCIDCNTI
jgi:hypothetical protein